MPLAPSCNGISDNTSVGFRVWHKPLDSLNHNKLTPVSAGSGERRVLHFAWHRHSGMSEGS